MYSIVVDTNCLQQGVGRDFSCCWVKKALEECCELIEAMDAHEYFKFLIPEIVLQEVRQHQLEKHKACVDEVRRLVLPSWSFEYDRDAYDEFLDRSIAELRLGRMMGQVPLEIMPLPSEDCIGRLVQRVLGKHPPFSGRKSETDKGFKDALIWESILEHKRKNLEDGLILTTGDGLLGSGELQNEFSQEFDEELIVVKNVAALNDRVEELIQGMELGYATPRFVGEKKKVLDAVNGWLSRNVGWIMEKCEISYHEESRVRASIEALTPNAGGEYQAAVTLELEDDGEAASSIPPMELYIAKTNDRGWYLSEIRVNQVLWPCDELLEDW